MKTPNTKTPKRSARSAARGPSILSLGAIGFGLADPVPPPVAGDVVSRKPAASVARTAEAAGVAKTGSRSAFDLVVRGQATPPAPPLPAPHLSRAKALADEVAAADPVRRLGRLNPWLDEACAALFGVERWCAYLEASGSATLRLAYGGRGRLYDFAPSPPTSRFDVATGNLVATRPWPRPASVRRLVVAHHARQDLAGDERRGAEARWLLGALAPLGADLVLGGDAHEVVRRSSFAWCLGPSGPGWSDGLGARDGAGGSISARDRAGAGAGAGEGVGVGDEAGAGEATGTPDHPVDAVLRLGLAAADAGLLEAGIDGAVRFAASAESEAESDIAFAEEMVARTIETLRYARTAASVFDTAILSLPYYGIVEGPGLRLMALAGFHMAQTALLLEARLAGRGVLTTLPHGAVRAAVFAPRLAMREGSWGSQGAQEPQRNQATAVDPAWFVAAFAAVRRFFSVTPRDDDDVSRHPYRPADLAEGCEHARTWAFAHMALTAERFRIEPSRADPEAAAELAFWRAGVGVDAVGRPAAHGFAPLQAARPDEVLAVADEPAGLMVRLRAAKRDAGIFDPLGDVAAGLRAEVTGLARQEALDHELHRLGCWQPPGDERGKTTTAFQRKVAAERRALAQELAADERAGNPAGRHQARQDGVAEPEIEKVFGLELGDKAEPAEPPSGWPQRPQGEAAAREAEILQLVPLAECAPRLKAHPAPLCAYQLEEPAFVTRERARRQLADAEHRAAAAAPEALVEVAAPKVEGCA